ncbi:MAG: FG-GAP-like repeat-containing protein [Candidatus Dojkabacteria bacterium]|nr:FG-GAP-like repeat-containing protein [Candidatus Dojkabacteria bacterium]
MISGSQNTSFFPTVYEYDVAITDIDLDGIDDFIGGSYLHDLYGTDAGFGLVFWGGNEFLGDYSINDADVFFPGNTTYRKNLGSSSAVGDFNGDNFPDIAFGAPRAVDTEGRVFIYYGNGSRNIDTTKDKVLSCDGSYLLGIEDMKTGDINGDGRDDLLVGQWNSSTSRLALFLGGADMDTECQTIINGESGDDWLARTATDIKDLDGDGYDDVCMGAYKNDTGGSNAGRVYCFFGSSEVSDTMNVGSEEFVKFTGEGAGDNFGRNLFIYDLNNDGSLDLIVGAYQTDTIEKSGYVDIFLGDSTRNMDTSADLRITIEPTGTLFGARVLAGDINNNDWADLYLSSSKGGNDPWPTTSTIGRTYIYEVKHGTPEFTSLSSTQEDNSHTLTGNITDSEVPVSGVQWSLSNDPSKEWYECEADDGAFDAENETFTCEILESLLPEGEFTVYLRSYDINNVYMPIAAYGLVNVVREELSQTGSYIVIFYPSSIIFLSLIGYLLYKDILTKVKGL